MEENFYEAETPEEDIKRYLKANNTLYDRMKNRIIENVLSSQMDFKKDLKVLEVGAGKIPRRSFRFNLMEWPGVLIKRAKKV